MPYELFSSFLGAHFPLVPIIIVVGLIALYFIYQTLFDNITHIDTPLKAIVAPLFISKTVKYYLIIFTILLFVVGLHHLMTEIGVEAIVRKLKPDHFLARLILVIPAIILGIFLGLVVQPLGYVVGYGMFLIVFPALIIFFLLTVPFLVYATIATVHYLIVKHPAEQYIHGGVVIDPKGMAAAMKRQKSTKTYAFVSENYRRKSEEILKSIKDREARDAREKIEREVRAKKAEVDREHADLAEELKRQAERAKREQAKQREEYGTAPQRERQTARNKADAELAGYAAEKITGKKS